MLSFFNLILQRCASVIDAINDRFTSYRLVLYFLIALLGWSLFGALTHQLPYSWDKILLSAAWLGLICWGVNKIFARSFNIPANKESGLITGLILAFILTPAASTNEFLILAAAAVAAVASKYILVFRRSHIFNPAAFGAFISGVLFNSYASWWIGTKFTLPLIALGGILILRKMKRFSLALVFCAVYVLFLIWQLPTGSSTDAIHYLVWLGIIGTSLIYFTVVMLCEPLTSPTSLNATLIYAILVGVFYSYTRLHINPEESLLIGNLFTFIFVPNRRYKLAFVRKVREASGIYTYVFSMPPKFKFRPGQYMEWTLNQHESDSRGNRRYLTISSSPTENELMTTLKVPAEPSAFKRQLDKLRPGDPILASYLAGSFTLPEDPGRKLALVAGGVGVTPFRSMVKYLIDSKQARDVALLYSANNADELAFRSLFSEARHVGLKSFYTTSLISAEAISSVLPDYDERTFFISGPYGFVQAMERALNDLNVSPMHIITDYFPGYGS